MKRKLIFLPLIAALLSLSSCGKASDDSYALYRRYLATIGANEPMSYEDWLSNQKGEKGEDGVAPTVIIGPNGNFFVNNIDTGVTAKGEKGEKGETGDDAMTPYEQYKAAYPEYTGTKEDWYNDLANGAAGAKEIFTVTFDSDGGSEVASQVVMQGEKIVKPENPIKEGYVFKCWTYENEPWSFIGLPVTSDMTLLAIWE